MARVKTSKAALDKLKAKGVTVKMVKKGEKPAESLNQPIEKLAVPKPKKQTANTPKVGESKVRQWELEVDTRDFQGYIKTVTITEI